MPFHSFGTTLRGQPADSGDEPPDEFKVMTGNGERITSAVLVDARPEELSAAAGRAPASSTHPDGHATPAGKPRVTQRRFAHPGGWSGR